MNRGSDTSRASSILILGAGGHARVIADIVLALGRPLLGFCDQDEATLGRHVHGTEAEVVCEQSALFTFLETHGELPKKAAHAVVGIGQNSVRQALSEALGPTLSEALVHPAATVSRSALIGPGTTVLPGVVVNAAARIGAAVILNTSCVVEHDCVLGHGVHLSPGAVLCGGVEVGDRTWVGANATVLPNVRLGRDVMVGAGSTVLRDVADGLTVVGSPARPIRAPGCP